MYFNIINKITVRLWTDVFLLIVLFLLLTKNKIHNKVFALIQCIFSAIFQTTFKFKPMIILPTACNVEEATCDGEGVIQNFVNHQPVCGKGCQTTYVCDEQKYFYSQQVVSRCLNNSKWSVLECPLCEKCENSLIIFFKFFVFEPVKLF